MHSLNPVRPVQRQIAEALNLHRPARAVTLLRLGTTC
jgi:ABC-type dipeptide/oligopeptide/nickel transport system ATPase component